MPAKQQTGQHDDAGQTYAERHAAVPDSNGLQGIFDIEYVGMILVKKQIAKEGAENEADRELKNKALHDGDVKPDFAYSMSAFVPENKVR